MVSENFTMMNICADASIDHLVSISVLYYAPEGGVAMDETVDGDVQPDPVQKELIKFRETRHVKVFLCHMFFCGFDLLAVRSNSGHQRPCQCGSRGPTS